jgi:hypothetical protein
MRNDYLNPGRKASSASNSSFAIASASENLLACSLVIHMRFLGKPVPLAAPVPQAIRFSIAGFPRLDLIQKEIEVCTGAASGTLYRLVDLGRN